MTQPFGRVYLVGAGCGPAEWITLRGYRLLQTCDAVVYDDLIAPELLDTVPPQAQKLYMGKRLGRHSAPQEDISKRSSPWPRRGTQWSASRAETPSSLAGGRGNPGPPAGGHPL